MTNQQLGKVAGSVMAGLLAVAPGAAFAGDKSETKDRIEDRADDAKDRVDEAAKREKSAIDRSAEVAKDKVDGKRTVKDGRPVNDTDTGAEVTDTWITTKVKAKFVGEDALKGSDISVDTNKDGVVTLTGTVPSQAARAHAVKVVRATKGVRRVDDQMRLELRPAYK